MRLFYLYVRHRNFSVEQAETDGHYTLIKELMKRGYVDESYFITDNYARPPEVLANTDPRFKVISVNGLFTLRQQPEPGDIIWIRGAWKPWIPWIEKYTPQCWTLYYAANAGHHAWPWWDVILYDLREGDTAGAENKLWYHYRKPVSPDFGLRPEIPVEYDVCCGASHIYDRKGQYRIMKISLAYEALTGKPLKVVMPGSFYSREAQTEIMRAELADGKWPNITMPGWVDRNTMISIYNSARFFYAATCGGQGDRCVPESGLCGCRQIIGLSKNHPPYSYARPDIAFVPPNPDDTDSIAAYLAENMRSSVTRQDVADYFQAEAGMDRAIDNLSRLFNHMKENPKLRTTLTELL